MNQHWSAYRIMQRNGQSPMWTLYRPTTREYPGKYVARLWQTLPQAQPTEFVLLHDSLEDLRDMLPPEATFLAVRDDSDPPEIIETWI